MASIAELAESLGTEINESYPAHLQAEADLELWLAQHIADLLEHRTEYLFNIFYCLDVDEKKMHEALLPHAPEAADIGLAKLLIARQKQRLLTKQLYKQPKLSDEDSGW
ncbi:MAG: hypothetical protein RI894_1571 [Bacteroidota bacterium]|jgi:hypothetical protein